MPTHSTEVQTGQDDICPLRTVSADNPATDRRVSEEDTGCPVSTVPDESSAPVQTAPGEDPVPGQTIPDDAVARHVSGDSTQSSSNSSCGSTNGRDSRHCSGCSACAAVGEASSDASARVRFRASVQLWRRPADGAGPRLRLTLRDSAGRATKPVPLPAAAKGRSTVYVPLSDRNDELLGEIDTIELNCEFDEDIDQMTEEQATTEHDDRQKSAELDGDARGDEASSLQSNLTQLKLQLTRCSSAGPRDAENARSEALLSSAGRQRRLYRRGDPERRRTPPPQASRLATRRRRLGLVQWPERAASVFVALVAVQDRQRGRQLLFPVTRWLSARLYRLRKLDSSLPQEVGDPLQVTLRRAELLHKRDAYVYRPQRRDNQSKQADIPEEKFPEMRQLFWKAVLESCASLGSALDEWGSFSEMEDAVSPISKQPNEAAIWRTDRWFGIQRLQGVNPTLITLCTAIPDKLGVDADMLRPFLEGFTLEEVIQNKKLFTVDLEILDGIDTVKGTELCAPVALFYLNGYDDLLPVAIQLGQMKGANNPVFLPSDPPNLWLMAKMFYNNAEAQHHQLSTLAVSYLLLGWLAVSVHRNLSPSHPLYRLLAPHLRRQLAASDLARCELLAAAGWLQRCGQLTACGRQQLVSRRLGSWRLDTCGVIPRQVAGRGVADPDVLPYYPYRDDACAIYTAIESYVRACLQPVYTDAARLAGDWELLQWRRELTLTAADGGLGLRGVPGDPVTGFDSLDQLVEVVTAIISTCTVGHAAASRHQHHQYDLPANYPLKLQGQPPCSKDQEPSEAELLQLLPGRRATQEVRAVTKLLGRPAGRRLAEPEVQYLWDPVSVLAAEDLWKTTLHVSTSRTRQNREAEFPYWGLVLASLNNAVGDWSCSDGKGL